MEAATFINKFEKVVHPKRLTTRYIQRFQKIVYDHYKKHGRSLPWRKTRNPYHILVSEIMLQQTQVDRVINKYEEFIRIFPDFATLAQAPLRKILTVWQGLGYNRRALALKRISQIVVNTYKGEMPSTVGELRKLPGIGETTAAAILAFAFNQPTAFIETNIRSVFIHFFFPDRDGVADAEILPLVGKTLDRSNPRRWYYALMDYGAFLKKGYPNPNRKSLHYHKQSPFEGSNRQIRGMILSLLTRKGIMHVEALVGALGKPREVLVNTLAVLEKEGFIRRRGMSYALV